MLSINEDFILYLLKEHRDNRRVADELLKMWYRSDVDINKLQSISSFLLNTDLKSSLLNAIAYRLSDNEKIFWGHLLEAIARVYLERMDEQLIPAASKEFFDPIFAGAADQDALQELVACKKLDGFDSRFEKIRSSLQNDILEKRRKHKEKLLDSAKLFKNERLIKEEENAYKELIENYPNDLDIVKLYNEFHDRKARELFKGKSKKTLELLKLEKKWNQAAKVLENEQSDVLNSMIQLAQKEPEQAYNLAVALHNMEQNELALQVLQKIDGNDKHWLEIELLIESERYLDVLNLVQQMERADSVNIESLLAYMYTKARAYYGLGKHEEAVAILKSIVEKRPNYRSAHSLLQQWQRISE